MTESDCYIANYEFFLFVVVQKDLKIFRMRTETHQ